MSSGGALQWFYGRKLAIATMHGKEKVLAKPLESALGVHCIVPDGFDTDCFGTFAGDVERPGDADFTLRLKCQAAMESANCDLAIASEGAFGPHPIVPFAAAGEERLMLTDKRNGFEITVRSLSSSTNFRHANLADWPAVCDFAVSAGFPEHGIILKGSCNGSQTLVKGLKNLSELESAFFALRTSSPVVAVQTDMRAMYNPTRMQAIANLCDQLLERICHICEGCMRPGFGERHFNTGLPCAWCGTPTTRLLSVELRCTHCDHFETHQYPDGVEAADPGTCPHCNP